MKKLFFFEKLDFFEKFDFFRRRRHRHCRRRRRHRRRHWRRRRRLFKFFPKKFLASRGGEHGNQTFKFSWPYKIYIGGMEIGGHLEFVLFQVFNLKWVSQQTGKFRPE